MLSLSFSIYWSDKMDWNPIYESPLVYPSQARNNNNKKTHQKSY